MNLPQRQFDWSQTALGAPAAGPLPQSAPVPGMRRTPGGILQPRRRPSIWSYLKDWGFPEWFIISQTALPALLYIPGNQAIRLPIRVGAYAVSLFGLGLWMWLKDAKKEEPHPAQPWLLGVLAYLALMILHPLTNSTTAGVAQTLLYLAVMAPVFWVPSMVRTPRQLGRLLVILLICNGINSAVGVLQVYDPERWMPKELSTMILDSKFALGSATYAGPDGRKVVRPPGLFDTPGAVCAAGTIAALLGLVVSIGPFARWRRVLALGLAMAGILAIYLSHVRASFVVVLGMMAVFSFILGRQKEKGRLIGFLVLAAGIIVVGLTVAGTLGGESIETRFATLFTGDTVTVYYASRGSQIEFAFTNLLSEYPFGAGLARWGMMRGYFGDPGHLDSTELWAEVQPNAWILDGGLVLLALYCVALVVNLLYELRLVRNAPTPEARFWGAATAAANAGSLVLIFSFTPFSTQLGLQFWFLAGALHGALAEGHRPS